MHRVHSSLFPGDLEAQPMYSQFLPPLGYPASAYSVGFFFIIGLQRLHVCVCAFHLSFFYVWRRLQRGSNVCSLHHLDQMSSTYILNTIELDKQDVCPSPRSSQSVNRVARPISKVDTFALSDGNNSLVRGFGRNPSLSCPAFPEKWTLLHES